MTLSIRFVVATKQPRGRSNQRFFPSSFRPLATVANMPVGSLPTGASLSNAPSRAVPFDSSWAVVARVRARGDLCCTAALCGGSAFVAVGDEVEQQLTSDAVKGNMPSS